MEYKRYSSRSTNPRTAFFGGNRLGWVRLKAEVVSNVSHEDLPGGVSPRPGDVGILVVLQPDDLFLDSGDEKYVVLALQSRPNSSSSFPALPIGILDPNGTFTGHTAEEISKEIGLPIPHNEIIDMTTLALKSRPKQSDSPSTSTTADRDEKLPQNSALPSPPPSPSEGIHESPMPLLLSQLRVPRKKVEELRLRLTGSAEDGQTATLKIVPFDQLWREGLRDNKALAAWALYEGLRKEGHI